MELIRSWLIGITCAAMILALLEGLAPPGAIRKIGKLTGGLLLLLAVLRPLAALDPTALTRALTRYKLDVSACSEEFARENRTLMEGIIAEQSAAYIADKAAQLGISCRVTVAVGGEGEYPVPETVTVTGNLTAAQRAALERQIEVDFAIPAQRQSYRMEKGGDE